MVGSTGTIMTMRLVRSKLRKREDSSAPAIEAQQPSFGLPPSRGSAALVQQQQQQQRPTTEQQQIFATAASAGGIAVTVTTTTTTTAIDCNSNVGNNNNYNHLNNLNNHYNNNNINNNINAQTAVSEQEQIIFTRTSGGSCNGWVFPPKAPTPNIYHCMNTDLLQSDNDKNGFKGFRKQFSGRFKRLVTKKTVAPPAVIPPELKPQLKTIYVY